MIKDCVIIFVHAKDFRIQMFEYCKETIFLLFPNKLFPSLFLSVYRIVATIQFYLCRWFVCLSLCVCLTYRQQELLISIIQMRTLYYPFWLLLLFLFWVSPAGIGEKKKHLCPVSKLRVQGMGRNGKIAYSWRDIHRRA